MESVRKKMWVLGTAAVSAAALSFSGAVAASATTGSSLFCDSVTADDVSTTPDGRLLGTGHWACPASDGRSAVDEIHHVSGWWHPFVAGQTVDAVYDGEISASGCYPSESGPPADYFNQVRLQNSSQTGDWVISGDETFSVVC